MYLTIDKNKHPTHAFPLSLSNLYLYDKALFHTSNKDKNSPDKIF